MSYLKNLHIISPQKTLFKPNSLSLSLDNHVNLKPIRMNPHGHMFALATAFIFNMAILNAQISPLSISVNTLFRYSQIDGNLPEDFPSASASSTYQTGHQGAWRNGLLYVNDYETATLLTFDASGNNIKNNYQGTFSHGITTDDAGNLILRNDGITTEPCRLQVYPRNSNEPIDISFSLFESGQTNYISASGDILSEDGGYIYFFPNKTQTVNIIKIANGKYINTSLTGTLSTRANTTGYVIPIRPGAPDSFIYQMRQHGYYKYSNDSDIGDYFTNDTELPPPTCNNTVGGTCFILSGHEMFLHPSGSDYNGGFTIRDMTAGGESIASVAPLGSLGRDANNSSAAFFTVERINEHSVNIYEYCMGAGYAAYSVTSNQGSISMSSSEEKKITIYPSPADNQISISTSGCTIKRIKIIDLTGRCVIEHLGHEQRGIITIDISNLRPGVYMAIINEHNIRRFIKL